MSDKYIRPKLLVGDWSKDDDHVVTSYVIKSTNRYLFTDGTRTDSHSGINWLSLWPPEIVVDLFSELL